MIKIKSISKRVLAIVLSIMMLLTSGIIGAVAANVELAETGVNHTGGYVYFEKPSTWTTTTYIYLCIGHGSYTSVYQMTKVANSNLYRYTMPTWDGATYHAVIATSSSWGSGNWSTSNLTNAAHCTTADTSGYQFKSGQYNLITCTNTSKNATISTSYLGTTASSLNVTNRANVYAAAADSTSYSSNAAAGTVSVSGYYMSSYSANSTRSAVSSTSSTAYASTTLTRTSTATLTATPNDGYKFVGWSTSTAESGVVSSNTTYTYTVGDSSTTYYALFQEDVTKYTVTFDDGTNTTTQTVAEGEYPVKPADPTPETGYDFIGWSTDGTAENIVDVTSTAITGEVTYYAVYELSNYAVTVNTNGNGGTASADVDTVTYGGTVTLTAVPDTANGYKFANWTIVGEYAEEGTVDLTATSITIAPSSDITATANFALEEYEVAVNVVPEEGGTATATPSVAEHGSDVILKAEANSIEGYVFNGWEIEGSYVTADDLASETITITVTSDITATANFKQMPMYDVTASVNNADAGTVTPESGRVIEGSAITLSAISNPGYVFESWTITSDTEVKVVSGSTTDAAITFIPYAEVTAVANFKGVTGTVNVTAAEGGSVDNAGGSVTYPASVTSTATANEADGYIFSGWTVTSEGTEGTDYTVTENDNTITVTVLTEGTVVEVAANFANAQKIKVYTYSDNGFSKLHLTENNGTETKDVYNANQSGVVFGNETWYTPSTGAVTLTAGYNKAITAQLFSTASTVTEGTVIYVELSDAWTKTSYAYGAPHIAVTASSNSGWSDNITSTDTTGVNNNCYIPQNDAYIGGGVQVSGNIYKFVIPDSSLSNLKNYGFMIYSKEWKSADFWELNTTHGTYSSTSNLYKISEANTLNSDRKTYCFSVTASGNMPTQTNAVDITAALYNGDEWLGKDEVWIYFDSTGNAYVATDRRQLNDYVSGGVVKNAYNNGTNDKGYTSTSWSNFTSAYEDAVSVLGTGASTQTEIDDAYTTLEAAYKALELTSTVTITGSHGAMPGFGTYFGTTTFPNAENTVSTLTGNIGDADANNNSPACTYIETEVTRGYQLTLQTELTSTYKTTHIVFGWVINGTDFVEATYDFENDYYVGTYTCSNNAVIVPIYFRADTIKKVQSKSDDEASKVIKVYAKLDESNTTWGNYIAAYTWVDGDYRQFGRWTGQLMIPDVSSPGMYYTYVERANPDNETELITGITFNNYGDNTGINSEQRYQAYDYFEFIELADQGFDNIVFTLKPFHGNENYPTQSAIDIENSSYIFDYFRDFSGNIVGIDREKLTEDELKQEPALYIVRTGPIKYNEGSGSGWGTLDGSDFYVDAYIYDSDGNYLGRCKTYELTNLEKLKSKTSGSIDLTSYTGAPVMVDYASLTTDGGGNMRYDGEWYGTKYGLTNVTISAEVAYLNADGTVTYYGTNEVENVGNAYFNGVASEEVPHGSEGHTISATALGGNDFVGWYLATKNEDGSISIDASATPLFTEFANTIDASSDAIYVAVFEEHPEGTFTVNNYYYTYADFAGQTISPYAPPVFGGDTSYSVRDVQIKKVYDSYTDSTVTDMDLGRAGTYTQSIDAVSPGDQLEITIYTKPTYSRDYMYAWYIQANDSYGVNFEEVGTDRAFTSDDAGVEQSFTFTYTVKEGDTSITIYSDVVHITPEITLTYIYNNRYNVEQKYIVKYTLTNGELNSYTPSDATIRTNAPYVDDLYKNVEWQVENVSADATNWTLRATESDTYRVTLNVDGESDYVDGKFNTTVGLYANQINENVPKAAQGLWYIDDGDGVFEAGTDEILGYGSYYGLLITGDVTVNYVSDATLVNQIILSDAVYGYERATDADGNVTTNKVYVDYIINNLLNCFHGGYIDVNENGVKDDNEPIIKDFENTNNPVSLAAIEEAGYTVDYGMVLELINTFNEDTKQTNIDTYYGTGLTNEDKIQAMIEAGKTSYSDTGFADTYFYRYSAKDQGVNATNKNRVLMTFGYNNTEANRNRYYNAVAYLTISNGTDTLYLYSNQATLNIAEYDAVTNS